MAETVRQGERERRSEARERRRSGASQPIEELDDAVPVDEEATGDSARDDGDGLASVKRAVATAALAAVVGGLGGAAKALLDKRASTTSGEPEGDTETEPRGEAGAQTSGADEPEAEEESERVDSEEGAKPEAGADGAEDEEEEPPPQPVAERDDSDDERADTGRRGAPASDAAAMIERARTALEELLGNEAESVSGLDRRDGRWTITLEVVEMRRIPESTDVLSSYEVVLDDGGDIIGMTRRRRYRRSQVEEV